MCSIASISWFALPSHRACSEGRKVARRMDYAAGRLTRSATVKWFFPALTLNSHVFQYIRTFKGFSS